MSALFLALVLTGMTPPALRAQRVLWSFSSFDGNICGLTSSPWVTLSYDPTQDATGDSGGSCHISSDYSQGGVFEVNVDNVDCCFCALGAILQSSDFTSIEFDVKWDNSSSVPLSYFNSAPNGGSPGMVIGTGPGYDISSFCCSNVVIPDAASNGWVHISAPLNPALPNVSFGGISFEKGFSAYNPGPPIVPQYATFWLDNLALAGPAQVSLVSRSVAGGNFTFSFPAIRNATYTILKSADSLHWNTLATGYPPGGSPATGTLSFTDTNASAGQSYYRVRIP